MHNTHIIISLLIYIRMLTNNNNFAEQEKISEVIKTLHNTDDICVAHNIMVHGRGALSSEKTECETFKE